MIGSLRGSVLERTEESTALIEVNGVGYFVSVTPRTLAELEPGASVFVYVHHHIREESQTLFGFLQRDERTTFQVLIATHGIGPALALAILGTHGPSALVDIIASNDIGALTLVPGVGKKTAERLLIELRNRLSLPMLDPLPAGADGKASVIGNVREALTGLGYGPEEVRDAMRELSADGDASSLLRDALKLLGAKRA
ncbi:MAG TPA: Holliday junction branch migration protein RuvA [Ilumatobacteraceae bacterium]|nr:Holliday junction branch migration protein RuvA [Ilumatobacteraceae bacterium]HRB04798.1 Holliday junction branch migration protein RuvA [Ilumatobacteraceae bacterium]